MKNCVTFVDINNCTFRELDQHKTVSSIVTVFGECPFCLYLTGSKLKTIRKLCKTFTAVHYYTSTFGRSDVKLLWL
ncbi:unnamed protein product [Heterobilharzia americana]|nr:unnamed protein product [Heterobilharzia americana]